jgi:hypothetical protein
MTVVLTLCAANYLAHAKTLGDSLREHNPDYNFVIGLVDRLPKELEPSYWHPYEVIPVETLGIPTFWEMVQKYDTVELNTAVKPFYMEHLYQRDPSVDALIYLDPDILVCSSFKPLAEKLRTYNIIVTPHSCTFDNTPTNVYYERGMLTTGIYNLGFLATSRSETTSAFLKWWQNRLADYCYFEQGSGGFVDQLWVILAPLYFPGVHVEKNPGYNMCYWNHFERRLSRQDGRYIVNGKHDLMFYHFSSFSPTRPEVITTRVKSRTMSFSDRPDLKPIYGDYCSRLLRAGYTSVSSLPWLIPRKPPRSELTVKTATKYGVRVILRSLPIGFQALLKRLAEITTNALK